ncbi:MAG: Gfo/Idh/MocA family oxidoreductase [Gemmatimonadetes bacterium]|nr:Gfo/Idh/MocA family oxidoreductase [Gemmatimonadota bacterium]
MAEPPKYRVGLIGAGRAGPSRARGFDAHPLCKVVAIADTDPANLDLAATRFGAAPYDNYESMLSREALDIVLAVLPVRPNADAVVAAAETGARAIFCEKPLTASLADADRMVDACATRDIPLGCGVMVSSHPDYSRAYQMVADGEIGDLRRIDNYDSNGQGGCHGLNLTRKFAQKSPVDEVIGWVTGDPHSDHEEPYDDAATGFGEVGGYLRFANGVESFHSTGGRGLTGMTILGTGGMLVNENNTALGLRLFQAREGIDRCGVADFVPIDADFHPSSTEPGGYDEEGWLDCGDVMRAIVTDTVRVLEEGGDLEISTGDDLRHALEMCVALRESHRRGRVPLRLPLEDRSLTMYPERSRWHYKKQILGEQTYMEQMRGQKRD